MKSGWWTAVLALTVVGGLGAGVTAFSDGFGEREHGEYGDRGEREWGEHGSARALRRPARGGAVAVDETYARECGGCHVAYSPGLLPPQSWERLLAGLEDHFGENAELLPEDRQRVRDYLLNNAAGRTAYEESRRMLRSLGSGTPLRITETRWFRGEHDELSPRMVAGNPEVGSFSNCDACHAGAAEGRFDEHGVRVPGYGRWED